MSFHTYKRLWTVAVAVLAVSFMAIGCGNNKVTVEVDVTSFIDEGDLSSGYSSPVSIPVTLDSDPIEVNLLEGSQDFAKAEELRIDLGIRYDNESGSGEASFTVFFADTPEEVFNTAPVATVPASLSSPNQTTISTAQIEADSRVLDLFTRERIYMGLRFNYNPASTEALNGTYTITSLMAHVVSTVEIF